MTSLKGLFDPKEVMTHRLRTLTYKNHILKCTEIIGYKYVPIHYLSGVLFFPTSLSLSFFLCEIGLIKPVLLLLHSVYDMTEEEGGRWTGRDEGEALACGHIAQGR